MLNENRPRAVKSKTFSAILNNQSLDFSVIDYSNCVFILVTDVSKIENIYHVQKESLQRNGVVSKSPAIFDIKCVLGNDTEEILVAVRALAEKLSIQKPIVISLTISCLDYGSICFVADKLVENRCW